MATDPITTEVTDRDGTWRVVASPTYGADGKLLPEAEWTSSRCLVAKSAAYIAAESTRRAQAAAKRREREIDKRASQLAVDVQRERAATEIDAAQAGGR